MHHSHRLLLLCLLPLCLLTSSQVFSQDIKTVNNFEHNTTNDGWLVTSFNWIEEQQDYISTYVSASATSLDEYIARDTFDSSMVNESYLRMRISQSISSGFDEDFDLSIKARVDVPNSRNRVQVFIDSEPDDFDSISDRRRDLNGSGLTDDSDDNTVAGLSFWGNAKRTWQPNLSIGTRFRIPLDPYAKGKVRRYDDLPGLWQSRFVQSASYYDSRGWRTSTEYDVYRPIAEDDILRISNEAQYINSDKAWEFYHGYSYYQQLDKKNSLEYSFSIVGANRPNPRVNGYWARLEWRKRLYKDWLFSKVSPEISFPRERNFSDTYAIFFELEVFFSDHYIPY